MSAIMSPPRCSCGTPMFQQHANGAPKCPHCDNVCTMLAAECSSCQALGRADLHNVSSKLPKWHGPPPHKGWDT